MTLRTGSLRIDAVAVALRRATIVTLEKRVELRELAEPRVGVVALLLAPGPVPALLEDDDGGGRAGEDGERIEVILPPLALRLEMEPAIGDPERRERSARPRVVSRRPDEGEEGERGKERPEEPAIGVPLERVPDRDAAHVA